MRENSSSVECLMQKGLEEVVGLDSGIGPAVHEVELYGILGDEVIRRRGLPALR